MVRGDSVIYASSTNPSRYFKQGGNFEGWGDKESPHFNTFQIIEGPIGGSFGLIHLDLWLHASAL